MKAFEQLVHMIERAKLKKSEFLFRKKLATWASNARQKPGVLLERTTIGFCLHSFYTCHLIHKNSNTCPRPYEVWVVFKLF